MITYKCKKGQHAFKPANCRDLPGFYLSRRPVHKPHRVGWKVRFRDSCKYDLGSSDQADWNKLPGLSWNLFTNHDDAAMLGWRWNKNLLVFEVGPYLHVDGKRRFQKNPELHFESGEDFWYSIEADYTRNEVRIRVFFADGATHEYTTSTYADLSRTTRQIHAWFGGNRPAPHDMFLQYGKVTRWVQGDAGVWWPEELYKRK